MNLAADAHSEVLDRCAHTYGPVQSRLIALRPAQPVAWAWPSGQLASQLGRVVSCRRHVSAIVRPGRGC